ncbi:PTS N-acetylgalactosamine transporter subunit IIB [Lacticaseibacillus brantae]|uniref:N-acetylgalactosamine-specific PTS system transporter subunit IIB n=1 Tax=Lacticaseibacillus brantae DSM 23927 TaxID=1423727 RepID=A0A0R2AYD5_9LACO|nr:PTS N-acetylgalactosamine transporter subunit IIB [Lacticaseibacillus brantae]KRM71781.1 N-acetylgalactosamine-specific PTS system transporter subunit IIB [Lacticaseibacillus brantae DSM 23927]
MTEPNILVTRIDNRLVHGQVGMTWVNTIGANLIVVANDDVSTDPVQQNLMEMVIPGTVGIRFFSIDKTIKVIGKAAPSQKILLVIRTPQDALALIKGGVPIKKLNIGNLHFAEGKKQLSATVSVSPEDIETFNELHNMGIQLEVQGIPNERATDLMDLLAKA